MTLLFVLAGFGACCCLGYFVSSARLESGLGNVVSIVTTLVLPLATEYLRQQALQDQLSLTLGAANFPGSPEPAPSAATQLPNGWVMLAACLAGLLIGGWQRGVVRRKQGLPEDGD